MTRINVTKSFLPPLEEYEAYLKRIWDNGWLTNQGPLLKEFEAETSKYLHVTNFHFVANGTLALQLALNALDITEGEVITTPFSFVATTSAILWERCTPVFVDIEPETFCIDPEKIEAAITDKTKAIMAVHVFGFPCNVEKIQKIAEKHNLKVIYDAAHTFGVESGGKSLLNHGDISICSFHATKLFHTVEGGCVITPHKSVSDKVELIKRFGFDGDDHSMLGINAKASEMHAAMGLVNLKHVDTIIGQRKKVAELYDAQLSDNITRPSIRVEKHNYGYYPVVFKDEATLKNVVNALEAEDIYPRRYFYPSLNRLPYIQDAQSCPIAEDITVRILCLPLYAELPPEDVERICNIVNRSEQHGK